MRKIGLIVALAVSGLGSAYANDVPVPSFNDNPQLYSHTQSSTGASAVQSRQATPPATMNYGPWIVTPSSGA